MKKIIGFAVAVILVGAIAFMTVWMTNNPEKKIIGKWTQESANYGFEFTQDGKVYLPVEFFDLGFGFEGDVDGTYIIDKKDDEILFNFSFYSKEYSESYDFEIKGDALTLTKESTGKSTVFTKQAAEE